MTVVRISPPQVFTPRVYHHAAIVENCILVFLAGQMPLARDGSLVGPDDLAAQVGQVAQNSSAILRHADAKPRDVVRAQIYVTTLEHDVLADAWALFLRSPIADAFTGACTLLGVTALGVAGQLVELELTAAIPRQLACACGHATT